MKEKTMKNKTEFPLQTYQKITIRLWESQEPTLKDEMLKTLRKIKKNHPGVKRLNMQWLIIQAIKNFIRENG